MGYMYYCCIDALEAIYIPADKLSKSIPLSDPLFNLCIILFLLSVPEFPSRSLWNQMFPPEMSHQHHLLPVAAQCQTL